ncbi:hypothetical protein ACP70R_025935 [Stipagrostis hirtigluma subsp. patula]
MAPKRGAAVAAAPSPATVESTRSQEADGISSSA